MKALLFHASNFTGMSLSICFSEGSLIIIASAAVAAILAADLFEKSFDRGLQ